MENEILSFSYTLCRDECVNRRIGNQVLEISRQILARAPGVICLLLLGGYGRGEGSVLVEGEDIVPLGDYDFLCVSRFPTFLADDRFLEPFQRKFRVQYHIGVDRVWSGLLPFLGKRIYWYEAKYGSKVLFGDRRVLERIMICSGKDIDVTEGLSLMCNRLAGLEMVFDPRFLEQRPSRAEIHDLIFQSVKATLACAESLLLLNGEYHYSYRERWRRFLMSFRRDFPELLAVDSSLGEDYERASQFKLRPDFGLYPDPIDSWFRAKRHVLTTLVFFLSRMREERDCPMKASLDVDDFPELLLAESRRELIDFALYNWNALRRFRSFGSIRWSRNSFSDVVRASLLYLALSISENGAVNFRSLDRSLELISSIAPMTPKIEHERSAAQKWRLVRDCVITMWDLCRK